MNNGQILEKAGLLEISFWSHEQFYFYQALWNPDWKDRYSKIDKWYASRLVIELQPIWTSKALYIWPTWHCHRVPKIQVKFTKRSWLHGPKPWLHGQTRPNTAKHGQTRPNMPWSSLPNSRCGISSPLLSVDPCLGKPDGQQGTTRCRFFLYRYS